MPELLAGERIVNFGAIKVPDGYHVIWSEANERYFGLAPDGTQSDLTWRRQSALWWCKRHAEGR